MRRLMVLAAVLGLSGCINEDLRLYEVELRGSFVDELDAGAARVFVEVHHAESGSGEFVRPLGLIERFELDAGERMFEESVLVPVEEGEGLVVYAWLDLDGDGVLCSIDGNRDEPAGLVELGEFPAHAITFELVLDSPCKGPELLWP
jgi:hypothetical protein